MGLRYVLLIGLLLLWVCIWGPKGLVADKEDERYGKGGYGFTGLEKASLSILLSNSDLIIVGFVQNDYYDDERLNTTGYRIHHLKIKEIIGTVWLTKELKSYIDENEKGEQFLYVLQSSLNAHSDGCVLLNEGGEYLLFLKTCGDINNDLKIQTFVGTGKDIKQKKVIIPKDYCFYVFGRWLGYFLISDPEKLPIYKELKKKYGEKYDAASEQRRLFKDSFGLDLKDAPELVEATRTFCRILELDKEEAIKAKLTELTKHEKRLYSEPAERMLKKGIKNKFIKQPQIEDKKSNESIPEDKPKGPDK